MTKEKREVTTENHISELPLLELNINDSTAESHVLRALHVISRGYTMAECRKGLQFLLTAYLELKRLEENEKHNHSKDQQGFE